jgi:FMN-dependent NADH-azoreductase
MTKPTIRIHNTETDEVIEREMNAEELAQWEADKVSAAAEKQAKQEAEAQRQALLERLGITEEEAKLLLS